MQNLKEVFRTNWKFLSLGLLICICSGIMLFNFQFSIGATNQIPKGYLDMTDCNYIGGWACDADNYATALSVHFYADGPAGSGTFVGATTANIAREAGVANACGGYANHGYQIATPAALKDGKSHVIYAYAINTPSGTNPLLTNSGKTIKCTVASACTPNAVSGCSVCKSDGSAWADDNSKCIGGKTCNLGTCVDIGVTFGAEEKVFDWSASKCEDNDIPDISARAFVDSNGKTQLLASHYDNYRMIGDNLASIRKDCASIMNSDLNTDASKFNDHEWIAAPYTLNGAKIYSLLHNEYHGYLYNTSGVCTTGVYRDCWYNSITSSISSNSGKTYTDATSTAINGHLVLSSAIKYDGNSKGPIGFFEPSNIIKANDGYYYAFVALSQVPSYNKQTNPQPSGICVMRTNEIKELSGTGKTVWKLWDGTGFNIENKNPYTQSVNLSAQVCKPVSSEYAQLRSVTWNTYLNKYLGVGTSYDSSNNKWFTIAFSDNLVNWSTPQKIRVAANSATNNEIYSSIIDPEVIVNNANVQTKNFEKSDSSMYLYFTRINDGNLDRDLIRIPMGLLKAGQTCAPGAVNVCKVCKSDGSTWVDDSTKCASGQTCSNGTCTASCTPKTCSSLGYTCGSASDGCGKTLSCGSCATGQTCTSGKCVSGCTNECATSGAKQCSGAGYRTCGNYDSDSCREWSSVTNCASGKTCSNGTCVTFTNYSPVGFFDSATCSAFSGWSCDKNNYSAALTIKFYADGTYSTGKLVGTVTANAKREAAVGTICGGYAAHGFSLALPAILKDGKLHTIYAYAIDPQTNTSTLLSNNPKKITCPK